MSQPLSHLVNKGSLRHPSIVAKIKAAVELAQEKAKDDPFGVHVVDVENRHGDLFLAVCGIRDRPDRKSVV